MPKPIRPLPAGARRRGRPPLPPDNATREDLLDAAQRLFARRGFAEVTLRELTDAAGQNLASVSYHFGSKEGLIAALVQRSAPSLIAERLQLLAQAEHAPAGEPRVRAILRALLVPVLRWGTRPETQSLFLPLLRRVQLDGSAELRHLVESDTAHLGPFRRALQAALPGLPADEIGWRLHCVLGIEHAIVSEPGRLRTMIGLDILQLDAVTLSERVIDFVLPGLLAAVAQRSD
jgi:AcrR family transcriptional regulator